MTIKEKILKIMELALEINPPEIKAIGKKRTAVFVDWESHCNSLDVRIFNGGWRSMADPDKTFTVYTNSDTDNSLDMIIAELEQIRTRLPGDEK